MDFWTHSIGTLRYSRGFPREQSCELQRQMKRAIKIITIGLMSCSLTSCLWLASEAIYLSHAPRVTGFQVWDMNSKEILAKTSPRERRARRKARELYRRICHHEIEDGFFNQQMVNPFWEEPTELIVYPLPKKRLFPVGSFRVKWNKERVILKDYGDDKEIDITSFLTEEELKRIRPRISPEKRKESGEDN